MSTIVGLGTASPSQVLNTVTFTSSSGADQEGTVPVVAGGNTITPGSAAQLAIAAATYAQAAIQVAGETNFKASNIAAGVSMWGTAGTFTADATATASQLLAGAIAYVNGAKITGNIPTVAGGNTITPGTSAQTAIAAATYATNAIAVAGDANLIASNIKNGIPIFGITGNFSGYAYGNTNSSVNGSNNLTLTISGLAFTPSRVIVLVNGGTANVGNGFFDSALSTSAYYEGQSSVACSFSINGGSFTFTITSVAEGIAVPVRWIALQ